MKHCGIYARVSTDRQARDGTSLDTQLEACREFARTNGYTITQEVREDMSGARLDRPGLDQIRNLAATGQVGAVVVYEVDRLSRSLGHQLLLVEEFDHAGVELHFVNSPLEESPQGKMFFAMKGAFAEYERALIQERTRRGKDRRVREGKVMLSWAVPYGYQYTPGTGHLEIVESEAYYVRKIFEWFVRDRATLGEICQRLEAMGVPTKRGARFGWHRSTVLSIATNETYAGTWHFNKYEAVAPTQRRSQKKTRLKSSWRRRPRDQWVAAPVPAIITPELFDLAQQQLASNKVGGRHSRQPYLLKSLLTCKQCGRRLVGWPGAGPKERGYRCTGKRVAQLRPNCRSPYILCHRIEPKLWEKLAALLSDKDAVMALVKNNEAMKAQEIERDQAELETLYNVEVGLRRERHKLIDLHLAEPPLIDRETLQERMAIIDRQEQGLALARSEVEARLQQHEVATANLATIEYLCSVARLGLASAPAEEQRQWIEALQLRGVVDGDARRIRFTGVIGDFVLSLAERTERKGGDDSSYCTEHLTVIIA